MLFREQAVMGLVSQSIRATSITIADRQIPLPEIDGRSTTIDRYLVQLGNNLSEYKALSTSLFRFVQAPKIRQSNKHDQPIESGQAKHLTGTDK